MSKPPATTPRWRSVATLAAAVVAIVWAGALGWGNRLALIDGVPDHAHLDELIARVEPARLALPADVPYRLLLVGAPADPAARAARKGLVEYAFAPVVVDVDSPSPLIVAQAPDEPTLDAWLAGRERFLLQRFGGGVALLREDAP